MKRIATIALNNYGPFRGEQVLEFPPHVDVFAIVARWEDDAERSNWAGKSFLAHSIPFALFDEYPSRLANDWVSDGTKEGGVSLLGDDGMFIERKRVKGSAELTFREDPAEAPDKIAKGKAAQTKIVDVIGVTKEDFFATCFVKQKQTNRFVVAKPSERLAIVSEWIGIDKVRDARAAASKRFNAARTEAKRWELPKDDHDQEYREIFGTGALVTDVIERYRREVGEAEAEHAKARIALAEERKTRELEAALRRDGERGAEIVAKGKALAEDLKAARADMSDKVIDEGLAAVQEAKAIARSAFDVAKAELASAAELARGQFAGKCPVNGKTCPVAAEIAGDLKGNRELHAARQRNHDDSQRMHQGVVRELAVLEERKAVRGKLIQNLAVTAEQAKPLMAAVKKARELPPPSDPNTPAVRAYEATSATWEAARAKLSRAETLARSHEAYERQLTERKEKHDAACRALAVAADQVEVFVRAEREIGQATIGQVERIANRLLSSAGVDLTVSMTWGRETQNLETHCHRCGWEYPRGRGVKECEDCQATRAPKYEERLDLHPSERSDGAAEDLAGLAIQLAAAAWRRAEKGISFGVVVLDEVTASLDTANRKAIARVLSKMIREVGFSQAFVISHSNEVSESLPGRIEIVAGKNGSTARVIT